MKPRLQATLGQHLVMTPQLQQAIRLLQLSAAELDAELATAVESNPLLDWSEPSQVTATGADVGPAQVNGDDRGAAPAEADWGGTDGEPWYERVGPSDRDDEGPQAEQVAETETLHDHLLWQLHLSPLSPRDRLIAVTLIESIDEDGYLREPLEAIADSLALAARASSDELTTVLHQIQRFDPVGVGARDLGECLRLQLEPLPADVPGKAPAGPLADGPLQRLTRAGLAGLAGALKI